MIRNIITETPEYFFDKLPCEISPHFLRPLSSCAILKFNIQGEFSAYTLQV